MAVFNDKAQRIGEGPIALGRTYYNRFANMQASKLLGGSAGVALAQSKLARPVVPTGEVKAVNPTSAPAHGISTPVLVGAGVLGVLALGLIAFKVSKG